MTPEDLQSALSSRLPPAASQWLDEALTRVGKDPSALRTLFPAAGRRVGRAPVAEAAAGDPAPWTADDAARALLLVAAGPAVGEELRDLHRYGDADEQRAIVRSLHLLQVGDDFRDLVLHGTRAHDPRLVRAALAEYGLRVLDDEELAQATLKAVFSDIPLSCIPGLAARATPRMARMLAAYALERVAASRSVPPDVWPLIDAHPPADVLAAIEAEREHALPQRRAAASAALAARTPQPPPELS